MNISIITFTENGTKLAEKIRQAFAGTKTEEAKKIILEDTADLLILDELNIVLATGMLPLEEVIDFLKKYKGKTEIITTGRGAPEELISIADLVTDMQEIKHYFHKGISSRDGIDH
jgi:cob(I)alamin adenosyltransferase